jgi:transposase
MILGLAPERKQSEIEKVMLLWGDKVLSQVEKVSMDLSYNYKLWVNKLCPKAGVTVDRFHVTKMIHEQLNPAIID